jgi:polygalacturonase
MQQGQMQLMVELTLSLRMLSSEVIDQELHLEQHLMDTLSSESLSHSYGPGIHLHYSVQQTWGGSSDGDFATFVAVVVVAAAAAVASEAEANCAGAVVVVAAGAAAGAAAAAVVADAAAGAVGIDAAAAAGDVAAAAADAFAAAVGVAAGQWFVLMGLQLK